MEFLIPTATSSHCLYKGDASYWSIRTAQKELIDEAFVLVLLSDGILELLPKGSARERSSVLLARISGCDLTMDQLTTGLGIEQKTGLPDDIVILIISRQSSHD